MSFHRGPKMTKQLALTSLLHAVEVSVVMTSNLPTSSPLNRLYSLVSWRRGIALLSSANKFCPKITNLFIVNVGVVLAVHLDLDLDLQDCSRDSVSVSVKAT